MKLTLKESLEVSTDLIRRVDQEINYVTDNIETVVHKFKAYLVALMQRKHIENLLQKPPLSTICQRVNKADH